MTCRGISVWWCLWLMICRDTFCNVFILLRSCQPKIWPVLRKVLVPEEFLSYIVPRMVCGRAAVIVLTKPRLNGTECILYLSLYVFEHVSFITISARFLRNPTKSQRSRDTETVPEHGDIAKHRMVRWLATYIKIEVRYVLLYYLALVGVVLFSKRHHRV